MEDVGISFVLVKSAVRNAFHYDILIRNGRLLHLVDFMKCCTLCGIGDLYHKCHTLAPRNSSSPGGSKRHRPSQVVAEEIAHAVGPGLAWRTSSLDTLFWRRRQWSPAQVHNSWVEFMASRDDSTIKGSKWKEKPPSTLNIGNASSSTSDVRSVSVDNTVSMATAVWPNNNPNESGGSRSLPPNYPLTRTIRPSVGSECFTPCAPTL